jgi:hypothetical protein
MSDSRSTRSSAAKKAKEEVVRARLQQELNDKLQKEFDEQLQKELDDLDDLDDLNTDSDNDSIDKVAVLTEQVNSMQLTMNDILKEMKAAREHSGFHIPPAHAKPTAYANPAAYTTPPSHAGSNHSSASRRSSAEKPTPFGGRSSVGSATGMGKSVPVGEITFREQVWDVFKGSNGGLYFYHLKPVVIDGVTQLVPTKLYVNSSPAKVERTLVMFKDDVDVDMQG